MNTPGFTAENSLNQTSGQYRQQPVNDNVAFGVQAALRSRGPLGATCGNCVCDPGMCCTATSAGCKCDLCGTTLPGGGGTVLTSF